MLIMYFNIKNSSVPTLFIWSVNEAQIKFHFASKLHVVTVPLRLGDNVKEMNRQELVDPRALCSPGYLCMFYL